MQIRSAVFVAGFTLWAASALAADAQAPVTVVRGTIAGIDAKSVSITKADGTVVAASIAPNASFSTVEPRRFEQIKATDFVGITSVPGPNGTLTAEEIHVIPFKGLNEGSYPWDHHPDGAPPTAVSRITNGTVSGVRDDPGAAYTMTNASVTAASGLQLKVTYQGSAMVGGKCVGHAAQGTGTPCTGVATVDVPPWTPIVAIVPATAADAKAGLAVFATVAAGAQGKPVALSIVVEKNGVKPQF
jgi:hypothetical protein